MGKEQERRGVEYKWKVVYKVCVVCREKEGEREGATNTAVFWETQGAGFSAQPPPPPRGPLAAQAPTQAPPPCVPPALADLIWTVLVAPSILL